MRFIYILYLVIGSIATSASAQMWVGPKAGFQLTYPSFDDPDYLKSIDFQRTLKFGFNAGGVLNYEASKLFSLHTELLYALKGKDLVNRQDGIKLGHTSSYHFIELPVLLRMTFAPRGSQVRWYANIGPHISYWLAGSSTLYYLDPLGDPTSIRYKIKFNTKNTLDGVTDEELDNLSQEEINKLGSNIYYKDTKRLQFGLDFGFGTLIEVSRGQRVMLDLRYTWGHTFMGTEESAYLSGYVDGYRENMAMANSAVTLSAAYLFAWDIFGKKRGGSTIKRSRR